jgi:hypothetical protein
MAHKKQTTGKTTKAKFRTPASFDGVYLLKMVLYLLLGSIWLKTSNGEGVDIDVPVGLMVGLAFTLHEHFQIDRKIEYAVLLAAMLFGYFASYGLYINF